MIPFAQRPEDFLPLTAGYFEILLTLAAGKCHGYALMQRVMERTDGLVRLLPGTTYRAFQRLRDLRLIVEVEKPHVSDVEDERRRYYRLTGLGRKVASAEAERLAKSVRQAKSLGLIADPLER